MESTTYISPHIIARRDEEADEEHVMYVDSENALVVFRSAEEAEKFRASSGRYPASEGFEASGLDHVGVARACVRHGLERVCMPEPWTGESNVEFFDAADFVGMLRESVLEGRA
jgi:hypothetical protein